MPAEVSEWHVLLVCSVLLRRVSSHHAACGFKVLGFAESLMTESLWPNRRTLAARDYCVLSASDDWLGLHKMYVLCVICPFSSLPTESASSPVCAVYVHRLMCFACSSPGLFNLGPQALLMRQKYKELVPPKE